MSKRLVWLCLILHTQGCPPGLALEIEFKNEHNELEFKMATTTSFLSGVGDEVALVTV